MKNGLKRIKNFIGFLRNDDVSMDAKSLYLVLIYSIIINAVYMIAFIIAHVKAGACFAAASVLFFTIIMYLVERFEEITFFKYVVVVSTNILIFPLAFFMTGNILNGALFFFILGIVFTFFLIKEFWVYIIMAVELLWYFAILTSTYYRYDMFLHETYSVIPDVSIPASFVAAAFAPIFIFIYQTVIYERAKKQLEDSKYIIESARFNKSRFLANVTHEIRTPMNAIIGMNELILREDLDPESRELAENIKTSSNQLLRIINNILEFSKLDSNKMELYPTKYDFRKLITEIIDSVSNEYEAENKEFYAWIDSKIPRTLFGDAIRIKQVFMYLLFSSIPRSTRGRINMDISGDIDITTNTVMLSATISETGFGLSESEIEAMLSAYTKYDSRQKSDFKGMGLELSICKEILELMGGTLSIQSVEGVGMSVHFEFVNYIIEEAPIVRVSPLADYSILIYTKEQEDHDIWTDILGQFSLYPNFVTGPNAFKQAIENKKYTHIFIDDVFYPILKDTIKMAQIKDEIYVLTEPGSIYTDFDDCKILRKPMTCICVANALNNTWDASNYKLAQKREAVTYPEGKVIIVDDSIVNLKVLEGMLSTFKVNTTKCLSGVEALSVLERDEFDLIILDQRMPEMDGIELLHIIRKLDNANAMVPILCATADFGTEVSRMLLNEGFQDYLAKPVRRFYLERMLRQYMPSELAVNILVEDDTKDTSGEAAEVKDEEAAKDPRDIRFETGLANLGGNTDAFASVLNAYYKEGLMKIDKIPQLLDAKDLVNYSVEVHALKSSSAAIGAEAMSKLFRELEFAGKASNSEFVEGHTAPVLDSFKEVLEVVKGYLVDNGLFEGGPSAPEPEGEIEEFDDAWLDEMINALSMFNIRETEERINSLVTVNYGKELNVRLRKIKECIDMFDYHKAKELLSELKKEEK